GPLDQRWARTLRQVAPQTCRAKAVRAAAGPRRGDRERYRRGAATDHGGRRGSVIPQELRALHEETAQGCAAVSLSGEGAGRVEWLKAVVAHLAAPVSDRQHLRAGIEGQRLPRRRSVGPAQRETDPEVEGRSGSRRDGGRPVQSRALRSL